MSEPNASPDTGQEESQLDIQHLLDYISNLSMLMADADRDAVYKFLINKTSRISPLFFHKGKHPQHLFSN